jgi:hypothetical protein
MHYTRITIFHILSLFFIFLGLGLGQMVGLHFLGGAGGVAGAIVGVILGYAISLIPEHIAHRSMFKQLETSSNEELWKIVNMSSWNFYQTVALLQLAARGQAVRSRLPRVVDMLESDQRLTRIYGWDALRLVFTELVAQVPGYNPRQSVEACRRNVGDFRRSLANLEHPNLPMLEQ